MEETKIFSYLLNRERMKKLLMLYAAVGILDSKKKFSEIVDLAVDTYLRLILSKYKDELVKRREELIKMLKEKGVENPEEIIEEFLD